MRVLIAVDNSEASDEAVSQVIKQMRPTGAEVELLQVLDPFPEKLPKSKGRKDFPDFAVARRELQSSAANLLALAAERVEAAGFSVGWLIQEGDVRALILEEEKTWLADLIILGAHPPKGFRRFFKSSVSEDISREAQCSVEIVRISECPACVLSAKSSDTRRSGGIA